MKERKVIELVPKVLRRIMKGEGYSESGDAWVDEEAEFDRKVREILDLIISKQDFPNVRNLYAESEPKCQNLMRYFNLLFWKKPEYLFLGEAPGEKGCARTGIPFTSERILRCRKYGAFFQSAQFIVEGKETERSSTVFWGSVSKLSRPVVAWNTFPLHPNNNREPEPAEIEWGMTILSLVKDLFPGIKIVSVGDPAKSALWKLGIKTMGHLTHPVLAHKFRSDFDELFASR